MNILIINHYAGTPDMGMEFRPYYFARQWIQAGHRVDILAADYSHIRRVNPVAEKDFQEEIIDGIHYHWVKTGRYVSNGAKRAVTMGQFIGKIWMHASKIVREYAPDVVICSSTYPLDTYVGQKIKRISKHQVKLIHEVHDMWPISPIEIGGMSPKHPFIRVMQWGENSFCRNADAVVSLLPNAKEYFIQHGMKAEKFHHVPNGIVLKEWENYQEIPEKLAQDLLENHEKGMLNLCFFGTIQKTYNLELLIKVVSKKENSRIALSLIGPGMDKEELKDLTVRLGGNNRIQFYDPIPKNTIPDLFHYIDATFVGAKSSKIFRFGICMNKLFDAMMGGKPILYMVDAPNNYVAQYKCGVTVQGQEEKDLEKGVEMLLQLSESELKEMGIAGKKAAVAHFNYEYLAQRFLDIIEEN